MSRKATNEDAAVAGELVSFVLPFKTCSCGVPYNANEWNSLPTLQGKDGNIYSGHFTEKGRKYASTFKNCKSCHSTMSVVVEVPKRGFFAGRKMREP